MKEHDFTIVIKNTLSQCFGEVADAIFVRSELIQYLNLKTIAASRGSKARGAFGNLYAIYTLVEDYINRGYNQNGDYTNYEGARFSDLMRRQRQLPFGEKLQNHALNHRLNQEFKKHFPSSDFQPILRDVATNRYWFNENLLLVSIEGRTFNLASAVIRILDLYIAAKQKALKTFINDCQRMESVQQDDPTQVFEFIKGLLRPDVDARIFEIVSFAILKTHYADIAFFWGWTANTITEDRLSLYKTGRTNANDGGIDFVMRPIGRFYQVTETLSVKKYFLDIDKVQKYPMTFVVKSMLPADEIANLIRQQAERQYKIQAIINRYMSCIEEIINIPQLMRYLTDIAKSKQIAAVMQEIIKHSRLEFYFADTL